MIEFVRLLGLGIVVNALSWAGTIFSPDEVFEDWMAFIVTDGVVGDTDYDGFLVLLPGPTPGPVGLVRNSQEA